MSSMTRIALVSTLLLAGTAHAQTPGRVGRMPLPMPVASTPAPIPTAPVARPVAYQPFLAPASLDSAIADWRRLRQSDGYSFGDYANFLLANPGFPGEAGLRKSAERALRPGDSPATIIAFFATTKPVSANGWARLAEAYSASGRSADAVAAARKAWASSDLSVLDEASLYARFAPQLTTSDHDLRADALLVDRKAVEAQRLLGSISPARRAAFAARIALQQRSPDAEALFAAVAPMVASDSGLWLDRARFVRDSGGELAARQMAARPHAFFFRPANPEKLLDLMVALARGASNDRQFATAFDIARQVDDLFDPGTAINAQGYAVRDDYTSLAWIAGTAAGQLGRHADAAAMFERYARGGKSLQVASKGHYWAARSYINAGRPIDATRMFEKAAATPELFYSQLALERLGRAVPAPSALPSATVTEAERRAFANRRIVQAVRQLNAAGNRADQALFIRALSEAANSESERILAAELAMQIGRQDLAVWTARSARNSGATFYYRPAFPIHAFAGSTGRTWSLAHGITRQESSFDRTAVSHANAYGMMQLLPSTAREQAGKMGIDFYDSTRLTSDPAFNVLLGTAYFQRLLDTWGGSYPLAVASYNAGAGNVRKWVRAYGDPRSSGVDMIGWIEKIPFEETRGYVQRVLENSVVYDRINPTIVPARPPLLSAYLGRAPFPGG
jgi:soluble lytic murein transglycosylase